MMIPSSVVNLCGHVAPIASVGCYLAPLPTIQDVVASETVGSLPLLPYTTMMSNSILWVVYGLMKNEHAIWTCNGVGCIFAAYYFVQFARNVRRKESNGNGTRQQLFAASTPTLPGTVGQHVQGIASVVSVALLMLLFLQSGLSAKLIGNLGVLCAIVMFASPLSVIQVVLETKSARSIPLPFTLVSILNCSAWVIYGWCKLKDVNVYLPNALGLLLSLIQATLKLVFGDGDRALSSSSLVYQGIAP